MNGVILYGEVFCLILLRQYERQYISACFLCDHEGDKYYHKICAGFLSCLNTVLTGQFSKAQSTIEMCTFGTEFVVMKTGI